MITVPKIQIALKNEFIKSSKVMAPNIFLYSCFESDFIRVTGSGYAIEYEIKLSKSDFRADFNKSMEVVDGSEFVNTPSGHKYEKLLYKSISKHKYLLAGSGPSEFYYVYPSGLIDQIEVPEWAGIIEVHEVNSYRVCIQKVRAGKRLNKNKISPGKLQEIFKSLYYRYWSELSKRNTNQILML